MASENDSQTTTGDGVGTGMGATLPAALRRVGMVGGELPVELMRALPESFVERYSMLALRVYEAERHGRAEGEGRVGTARVTRLSTGQTETRGGAKSTGKRAGVNERQVLPSMAALAYKSKVDRKLRKIAREMAVWLKDGGTRQSVRRCVRCCRFGEEGWSYCPTDGQPMQEVE